MSTNADWVTVEGVRYVPEAPLKAEIGRLQAALKRARDQIHICDGHDLNTEWISKALAKEEK